MTKESADREAVGRLKSALADAEKIESTGAMVKCADLRAILSLSGEETIPAGMVPWAGGDIAPADWDGGDVRLDWGDGNVERYTTCPAAYIDWRKDSWRADLDRDQYAIIIAYTPKAPAPDLCREPELCPPSHDHDLSGWATPMAEGAMTPEGHALEDAKQFAAFKGNVISFDVHEPYYLCSCDHCGWVGSKDPS